MAKFKNIKKTTKSTKKKPQPKKLPSNYRKIPDKFRTDDFVFILGILCIFIAIIVILASLYINIGEEKSLVSEKERVLVEKAFWENEIEKKPDYRDAYFSLALINFQLNDKDKSRENVQKTLEIDPNFQKARDLEELLK